ncbi:hypothetical protein F4810DRAFT_682876 [Camillea tinctor]|nr:hypothetical protein F4810DRAFT_682876 [Camillea tinctor]
MAEHISSGNKSQKRRWQNVIAQRNYRRRQQEKRGKLERLAIVALVSQVPPKVPLDLDNGHFHNRVLYHRSFLHNNTSDNGTAAIPDLGGICLSSNMGLFLSTGDVFSYLASCNELERRNFFEIMTQESFGIRDIFKYGLISLGYTVSPSLYNSAGSLPMRQWMQRVAIELGYVDLKEAFRTGLTVFGKLKVTSRHGISMDDMFKSTTCPATVDPAMNYITISRVSFTSAIMINALHLGIPWYNLLHHDAESPFPFLGESFTQGDETVHYNGISQTPETQLKFSDHFSSIGNDLIPTAVQLTIRHHPTLDTIPWANFRSKAILAIYSDPPSIDENDFCLDLFNDGVGVYPPKAHTQGSGHNGIYCRAIKLYVCVCVCEREIIMINPKRD